MSETRKIAAILVADVVGYSRLAARTRIARWRGCGRCAATSSIPTIAVHHGRIVKRTGDGSLIEFRSVVDAVRCAIEVQSGMVERNVGLPPERRIEFRVGIHLGRRRRGGRRRSDGRRRQYRRADGRHRAPGAICLSEDAYRQVKGRLDLAVTDLGPTRLKNIAEPIRVYSLEVGKPAQAKPAPAPAPEKSAPPRLSIVVLPFANIGGDPEQEHFVDGVTESLTTDLSRIRGAFVIGRNTAFTYKGKAVDLKQIGRELNVRYVLEGSVQRGGNRMRVNVQLIDAETGNHLWAERFEKPLADLFDMQDEIVARLANALNAQLVAPRRDARNRPRTPTRWTSIFRVWLGSTRVQTPDNVAQARGFFDRALAADPDNVDALVASARTDVVAGALSVYGRSRGGLRGGRSEVHQGLGVGPGPCARHMYLGLVHIFTKRAAEGIAECEHALPLDRNLAEAHCAIGLGKIFIGRAEETEAHIAEALRLSPRDTVAYFGCGCGQCEGPPRQLPAGRRVVSTGDRGQSK